MTTPGGWTPPIGSPLRPVATGGSGIAAHSQMTEADWKAILEDGMRPHWDKLGDPISVLKELVHAVISALKGDFGPFIDLIGQIPIIGDAARVLEDLLTALRGQYAGSDPILTAIQSVTAPIRTILDPITGLVRGVLLPLIPIGKLEDAPVNLLDAGDFSDAPVGGAAGTWWWDGSVGRSGIGSATITGPAVDELISPMCPVAAGSQVTVEGFVSSLAGSTGQVTIRVRWWNAQTEVGTTQIGQVTLPAAGWSAMSKPVVAPSGTTHATVHVETVLDAGQVWVDDLTITKPGSLLPQSWIKNLIPDLSGIQSFAQSIIDAVIRALRGIPIVGGTVADIISELGGLKRTAVEAVSGVEVAQAQIVSVQQIFSVRSNRPLWEGLDPTGESSIPLASLAQPAAHTHSSDSTSGSKSTGSAGTSTHHVDSSRWVGAHIRIESPVEKRTVTFLAQRGSSAPAWAQAHLARLLPDGSYEFVGSTGSFHEQLFGPATWHQIPLTAPHLFDQGDVALVVFAVEGGGQMLIHGVQLPGAQNDFGFRPKMIGAIIQPSAFQVSVPGTIAITAAAGSNIPAPETVYVQLGADVGQVNAPRNFFDNFNRSDLGSMWVNWRGTSGGSYLSISGSRLVNPSNQLLLQHAASLYTMPLATDKIAVEWDVLASSSFKSGVVMFSSSSLTNFILIRVGDGKVEVCKSDSLTQMHNATIRASAPVSGTSGRWTCSFDPETRKFTVWQDGIYRTEWTDTSGVSLQGKGHRYCGAYIEHGAFSSGSPIDNWNAFDITDENSPEGF